MIISIITGAMVAGMVVLAMPLAIVGNNFSAAWEARDLWLIGERLKYCMMPQCHQDGASQQLAKAFALFDSDMSGIVSCGEFSKVIHDVLQLPFTRRRLLALPVLREGKLLNARARVTETEVPEDWIRISSVANCLGT